MGVFYHIVHSIEPMKTSFVSVPKNCHSSYFLKITCRLVQWISLTDISGGIIVKIYANTDLQNMLWVFHHVDHITKTNHNFC